MKIEAEKTVERYAVTVLVEVEANSSMTAQDIEAELRSHSPYINVTSWGNKGSCTMKSKKILSIEKAEREP